MPSRLTMLAILAFWLAATGWFAARDIAPHWRAGDPPPYTIELADEAMRNLLPVRWTLSRNGKPLGVVRTHLRYSAADDNYELSAEAPEIVLLDIVLLKVVASNFRDVVCVSRDGELRATHTYVQLRATGPLNGTFTASLDAVVARNQLLRRCTLVSPGIGEFSPTLEPIAQVHGSILNPLHPVPRITGLRLGQRWRQPLVAPHGDILRAALAQLPGGDKAAALAEQGPKSLDAEVREGTMPWNSQTHDCFVIEFRGDEFLARVWVDKADGLVLRQEADSHGETMRLERE
ncbi:MAG: hypothetical protein U0746_05665 [Gemmataceae bacterium]